MITPHGAALLNMMLMPPMSAVIELFPYHMHHALYVGAVRLRCLYQATFRKWARGALCRGAHTCLFCSCLLDRYATMATHLGIVNYPVHAVHGRPTWEGEPVRELCVYVLLLFGFLL